MQKEQINALYHKYKFYIFPAVIGISSLILIAFVIYPQIMKLLDDNNLEQNIAKRSQFLEVKAEELEMLDEDELTNRVNLATGILPPDRDFGNVIEVLQRLTGSLGFTLISVQLGQTTSGRKTDATGFVTKVELIGPQAVLGRLINDIENGPRIMKIQGIELSSNPISGAASVTLSLDVFYSGLPKTLGNLDAPLPKLSSKEEELISKLARSYSPPSTQEAESSPRGKLNPFE